jgi:hypothetical protein
MAFFSIEVARIKTPCQNGKTLLKKQLFDFGMKEISLTVSDIFVFKFRRDGQPVHTLQSAQANIS